MEDSLQIRDVGLTAAEHDFSLRVYPAAVPDGTVLVWLHGGAFMFGDLEMPEADETARQLAARGTTVFSLDYTLGALGRAPGVARARTDRGDAVTRAVRRLLRR